MKGLFPLGDNENIGYDISITRNVYIIRYISNWLRERERERDEHNKIVVDIMMAWEIIRSAMQSWFLCVVGISLRNKPVMWSILNRKVPGHVVRMQVSLKFLLWFMQLVQKYLKIDWIHNVHGNYKTINYFEIELVGPPVAPKAGRCKRWHISYEDHSSDQ